MACATVRAFAKVKSSAMTPPAVGSKLDRGHECREKYTRCKTFPKQPDWPARGGLSGAALRAISRFFPHLGHGRVDKPAAHRESQPRQDHGRRSRPRILTGCTESCLP